jgi:hypothetical protein
MVFDNYLKNSIFKPTVLVIAHYFFAMKNSGTDQSCYLSPCKRTRLPLGFTNSAGPKNSEGSHPDEFRKIRQNSLKFGQNLIGAVFVQWKIEIWLPAEFDDNSVRIDQNSVQINQNSVVTNSVKNHRKKLRNHTNEWIDIRSLEDFNIQWEI